MDLSENRYSADFFNCYIRPQVLPVLLIPPTRTLIEYRGTRSHTIFGDPGRQFTEDDEALPTPPQLIATAVVQVLSACLALLLGESGIDHLDRFDAHWNPELTVEAALQHQCRVALNVNFVSAHPTSRTGPPYCQGVTVEVPVWTPSGYRFPRFDDPSGQTIPGRSGLHIQVDSVLIPNWKGPSAYRLTRPYEHFIHCIWRYKNYPGGLEATQTDTYMNLNLDVDYPPLHLSYFLRESSSSQNPAAACAGPDHPWYHHMTRAACYGEGINRAVTILQKSDALHYSSAYEEFDRKHNGPRSARCASVQAAAAGL